MDAVMALPGGAYNFGSETTKSMHEITRDFLRILGKDVRVDDAPSNQNLWMNCDKARKYGVDFSSVEDGLKKCAIDYGMAVNL
jgi:dTDP-4-dehydrorhamnose reductase